MFKINIKREYKIGRVELFLFKKHDYGKTNELILKKDKFWYLEFYSTNEFGTRTHVIFMNPNFKREEAIKYLKLIYDVQVYDLKHSPNLNLSAREKEFMKYKDYKLSKDKRAILLDNLIPEGFHVFHYVRSTKQCEPFKYTQKKISRCIL